MYQRLEQRMVAWMAGHGVALLRVSLGIVFLWFGALKFVPALCPAKDLACATMAKLTFGLLQPRTALAVLAVWETAVGWSSGSSCASRSGCSSCRWPAR